MIALYNNQSLGVLVQNLQVRQIFRTSFLVFPSAPVSDIWNSWADLH